MPHVMRVGHGYLLLLQILIRLDLERPSQVGLGTLLRIVNVLVLTIATVPYFRLCSLHDMHTKI